MGTRADFYIGRGIDAEWLGSLAWDGYRIDEIKEDDKARTPDNAACWAIKNATTEAFYRQAVAELLAMNEDATLPESGWPWPWEDSRLTDYSYAFDDGKVFTTNFGYKWYPCGEAQEEDDSNKKTCIFPDMTKVQNVQMGKKSGLIVVQS